MEIVTFIKDIINETKNEYNVKKNEISDVKKYIISLVKSIYDKDKKFTMYILDQLLEDNLEIIDTDIVLPRDNETILIPEDRIADVNHLKYIRELPQPEQRTERFLSGP